MKTKSMADPTTTTLDETMRADLQAADLQATYIMGLASLAATLDWDDLGEEALQQEAKGALEPIMLAIHKHGEEIQELLRQAQAALRANEARRAKDNGGAR